MLFEWFHTFWSLTLGNMRRWGWSMIPEVLNLFFMDYTHGHRTAVQSIVKTCATFWVVHQGQPCCSRISSVFISKWGSKRGSSKENRSVTLLHFIPTSNSIRLSSAGHICVIMSCNMHNVHQCTWYVYCILYTWICNKLFSPARGFFLLNLCSFLLLCSLGLKERVFASVHAEIRFKIQKLEGYREWYH